MNELRERRYILIEWPDYIGQQVSPAAEHNIVHVDFRRDMIEIQGTKFGLRAFLRTAGTIAEDQIRYRQHKVSKIRFTTGGAEEKWETFAMKREDLNGTQDG